jgi:hypothetical protein
MSIQRHRFSGTNAVHHRYHVTTWSPHAESQDFTMQQSDTASHSLYNGHHVLHADNRNKTMP